MINKSEAPKRNGYLKFWQNVYILISKIQMTIAISSHGKTSNLFNIMKKKNKKLPPENLY